METAEETCTLSGVTPAGPRVIRPLAEDVGAMALVQASGLCSGLPQELLDRLINAGRVLDYGLGQVVFSQGAQDDAIYIVLEGSVSICKEIERKLVEVATLARPVIFGEISVLTQRPRSSTVVSRTETRLIELNGRVVREVAAAAPKLGRRLAALMAGRSRDNEKKLGT